MKKLSSIFLVCLCLDFSFITLVNSQQCDKAECGCQFSNGSGVYEISMKGISRNTTHPFFTDVPGAGDWIYSIDPCYGYYENSDCQRVAMCRMNSDRTEFSTVAKPLITSYGVFEEGKPLRVTYATYNSTKDDTVRQLIINLNYGVDVGTSKVSQRKTSSSVDQFTIDITSPSLRPRLVQPGSRSSSSSGGGLSIGSYIIIVFFVVLLIYLVFGAVFMKFRRGATGIYIIPNVGFWASLPGLIKDGFIFTGRKVIGLCG
ncbi:uncharacterized protein LOC114537164 [Dendronephthya gigantea]|uniref:uncharacterized protein LOC114537164 n=1 Tax=Dendronephthya gigantea TaxID=151771 RepID=UPI0010690405|nr:uncharacterized protein LOC114537164 [Dendronephthya gigantea]XP_028414197.1 uncharacterized protein LOC114537164 [Dendronephthya gigantea]